MKKIIAILMAMLMLVSFAACDNGGKENETASTTASTVPYDETSEEVQVTDASGETVQSTDVSGEETTAPEVTALSDDPSTWTTEEIVAFYKAAALKSQSKVKSTQTMEMTSIVANDGNGFLGTLIEWVTPIFKAALKKNSTQYDGVTGGHEKLVASDVKSAKAYKSGEYIVIEMTMKEQTDGIHGDWSEGTVGHAISVVGDISVVAEELPQFFIDFENCNLELRYTKPTVKVKINKDGIIEKGTWSYVIDVQLSNLYIEALKLPIKVMVESGYGSVDYKVTVGGGF